MAKKLFFSVAETDLHSLRIGSRCQAISLTKEGQETIDTED